MENKWSVYKHTSPSGKVYVGITTDVKKRWACNGRHYCSYNSIFKLAIEKYGWDSMAHEVILEGVSKSEAIYTERYLIKWYKLNGMSYNVTDGGDGFSGVRHSEESKRKISESHMGLPVSPKAIANSLAERSKLSSEERHDRYTSFGMKGKHHSLETREKQSKRAIGRDMSKAIHASIMKRRSTAIPIQVSKGNTVVGEYQLVADACKELNLDPANVYRALKHGYRVNGYSFVKSVKI